MPSERKAICLKKGFNKGFSNVHKKSYTVNGVALKLFDLLLKCSVISIANLFPINNIEESRNIIWSAVLVM